MTICGSWYSHIKDITCIKWFTTSAQIVSLIWWLFAFLPLSPMVTLKSGNSSGFRWCVEEEIETEVKCPSLLSVTNPVDKRRKTFHGWRNKLIMTNHVLLYRQFRLASPRIDSKLCCLKSDHLFFWEEDSTQCKKNNKRIRRKEFLSASL